MYKYKENNDELKNWLTIIVLILVSMILKNPIYANNEMDSRDSIVSECPSYVRFIESDTTSIFELQLSDDEFGNIAGSVIFPVNKYILPKDAPLTKELETVVIPMANRRAWQLLGLQIKSASSPEGPYQFNQQLAFKRGNAIMQFLEERLDIPAIQDNVIIEHRTEDYDYLLFLMRKANDSDTEKVEAMWEKAGHDSQKMKKAFERPENTVLWRRLLNVYYPKIRSARLVIFFRKYEPEMYFPEPIYPKDSLEVVENIEIVDKVENIEITGTPAPELEILRAPALAIKSNLLYDAFYMPNFGWAPMPDIELEYFPRKGNFSYIAALTFPYWEKWSKNKFFEIRDYRLEARYNFSHYPLPITHYPFVGVSLNNNIYGIGLSKTKGWQGEGLGASITAGFTHRLGKDSRWRMEYVIGLGYYETRFDPYVYGNPINGVEDGDYYYDYTGEIVNFHRRNYRRRWFGPTQFGIKLSYDLFYHKVQSRGWGIKRKEMVR